MLKRILIRILDGILFFPVAIITTIILPTIIDNRAIRNFCYTLNYLHLFIGIMVVSIGIGIFQNIKGYDEKKYDLPKGGIGFSIIKSIVIATVAFLIMPHIQSENVKLSRVLLLVWLFLFAMLLQAAFLGQRSIMGKLFAFLWSKVRAIFTKIADVVFKILDWIDRIAELLGPRLTTAILELIVLTIVCAVILNISDAMEVHADKEYQVLQVVEEYADFFSVEDINCPTEGIMGTLLGIKISGFTYVVLNMLPVAGIFAGVLCFWLGIGWVSHASKKIIGWHSSLAEELEARALKSRTRTRFEDGHMKIEIEDRTHPVLQLILFFILSIVNGFVGIVLPVFILLNTIVGIVPLIIELIARKYLDKEETL